MRAELEVLKGSSHQKVRIAPGETVTIGRSRGATLQILSNVVSRLHCRLHHDGKKWILTDLDSRNGTWVDAAKLGSRPLASGDVFTLGKRIAVRFAELEPTGEIDAPAGEGGACAFCMRPLGAGDGVRDAEGHVYHGGCRSLANLVGAELGGVRIIERLDGDGRSHRLRAHQPSLNRHVLLHAFDEGTVATADFRDRLLGEVRAISRLLHPNLLQIHDLIDHRGAVLVVMEYLSGQSLKDLLEKRRFVSVPVALSLASQVAEALAYAQEQEVVLNRLSPAEIQVNDENQAKVDLFHPPFRNRLAPIDLPYVAPEVIQAGALREPTPRVGPDRRAEGLRGSVYSLGAILYHMLSGIPPFEGETEEQLLPKIMKTTPPALRRVNLKVSAGLARVVERAMDKDPTVRPPDFRAFQVDLRKIIAPAI